MDIRTQKFFILGVSKSGYSACEYLLNKNAECYIFEELKSAKIEQAINTLTSLGAKIVQTENYEQTLSQIDVLIISPGVPINHPVAVKAKELGKRIIGELEFAFSQFVPTIIGVTGTNGKTTTVNLIDSILNESSIKSRLVGNVGVPVTSKLNESTKEDIFVTEVSSFQLESVNAFCPHISCILNISPDHLERHYTMDNYVFLKKRIFKNQRESEFCVLNYDDILIRGFFPEIRAKVIWVSLTEQVEGAYRLGGKIYYKNEFILNEDQLKLKGEHNLCDTLFAIACAKLLECPNERIVNALVNFKGIKHRMEFIGCKDNVNYFNDSKATNTASTINALQTLKEPTILILGGSEKGEKYIQLFENIKKSAVKSVILTGASRFNMLDDAGKCGFYEITLTKKFEDAVRIAKVMANAGENVLLSPACASFDEFSGYEERGEKFIELLGEM